ncbi:MAG: carbohydrate-binding protein, partial [Lacipirellulaceae bacterium]
TDMTAGEWVRYSDVDFGEPGQYDRLDFLQIRPPGKFETSIDNVGIQVRLGSPTGPLLTEIERVRTGTPGDRWRADRGEFSGVSGLQDLYVSVSGANSSNLGIGSFRLLKSGVPAEDRLTARISSPGSLTQVSRLGSEDWIGGYEEITFTTGPTATEATVEFSNDGRLNAYLDRVLLVESYSTRGDQPRDISSGAVGFRSIDATTAAVDGNLTDGLAATETVGGDHVGSWVQVDLGQQQAIYDISLAAPQTAPGRLSNFRVSVWSSDPQRGGTELWGQDFLTDSHSLDAGEVLKIQADSIGRDGQTRLNSAQGRFIRVQLLGPNSAGGNQIALGEIQINGYDLSNLTTTDSIASQSSTAGNNTADLAGDTAAGTYSETLASATNSWWQTRFVQSLGIGQIEITNRDNASFSDLSNFKVSVWDESPADGGTKLWEKDYFSTGSLGRGETLRIDGGEVSDTSTRRLGSVHTGRVVRIELLGTNKNGNGRLALENVRVAASFDSPSLGNVAQRGIASQKNDHYGDGGGRIGAGSAIDAIDGDISTVSNFTSAKSEPGVWWQVELPQETPVEQIVLYNRTDSASRLNNFNVTVWDGDPEGGGTELWGQTYNYSSSAPVFSTGSFIGAGGALIIDGSDTDGGLRLDDVQGARYVRVQLNTANILSLAEVQVWTPVDMVDLPGPTTSANLDLGTPFSPVHNSNWQGVSPTTYGDIWWYGQPNSDYQLAAPNNNINRDFVTSTEEATLNVRVQPGVYRVTLNMGDADNDRDNMQVWAES